MLTFLAVAGAVATVVLSKWSLDESQKAIAEAQRATNQARRQADASEKQVGVAQDIEQRQLRAYLHVLPGNFAAEGEPDGTMELTISQRYRAFGQTPAGTISLAWAIGVITTKTASLDPAYLVGRHVITDSAPPGEDRFFIPKKYILSVNEINDIKSGKRIFVSYGTVLYSDIFNIVRFTNFCYGFGWEDITNHRGEPCPTHNQVDWSEEGPSWSAVNVPQ